MDFRFTPSHEQLRHEVRSFLREALPNWETDVFFDVPGGDDFESGRRFNEKLAARGWIAPAWPKEYGGLGAGIHEQMIFNEEFGYHGAPDTGTRVLGVNMLGPTLIIHGTEEQKREHLPRITSGDAVWCQGYSEPGAGSDLASLQTRAVRDGDDYVINGQKIWTSGAHRADWMFMLVRTDPDAPKHRGISMLLVDMKSPGISVQPLVNMAGGHQFNQEFFDNVRVPIKNRVGEENRGWYVGATLLDFERSGIGGSIGLRHQVNDLVKFAQEAAKSGTVRVNLTDPVRAELADRAIEAGVAELISYRIISMQKRGQVPNYEASVNKVFRSEASQRLAATGMKLIGMYGNVYADGPYAPLKASLARRYLSSVSATIAAGTSEVNRNVIATRGLGLPRG